VPTGSKPSTLQYLQYRQRGTKGGRAGHPSSGEFVKHRINAEYSGLYGVVSELKLAIDHTQWVEIGRCVGTLVSALLDGGGGEPFSIPSRSKQQRDMFVSLGGVRQLLRLLEPPLSTPDARAMTDRGVKRQADVWNEALVTLREVFYSTPLLADKVTTTQHIVFLFTMLHHQSVFENSMNLLEEILASRNETFSLAEVPRLYPLVQQFSTRQVAHFCRVLALILFESEDRQIMESAKVLKSFELLHLRKDRMTRASFNIVELNQSLVIGMPNMLKHFITILNLLNYGPTVSEYVSHNVSGHVPLSSDILSYLSGRDGPSEWKHFDRLHKIASGGLVSPAPGGSGVAGAGGGGPRGRGRAADDTASDSASAPPTADATAAVAATASAASGAPDSDYSQSSIGVLTEDDAQVMQQLLNAFSASQGDGEGGGPPANYDPISNILNVMQVAHSIGIAPSGVESYDGVMQMLIQMSSPETDRVRRPRGSVRAVAVPPPGADDTAYYNSFSPADARHELQFHAMVLAPHQVEVLFVMCTLLCGRRKIQVQDLLFNFGLSDVLWQMNLRMSWDAPPYVGPNPYEHIHGPSCECNPESALRVQFLRLVHNFYDRDFMNNPLKLSMLSRSDAVGIKAIKKEMLMLRLNAVTTGVSSEIVSSVEGGLGVVSLPADTGLMGRITATLMQQPRDSVYQFWLCSCVECFLRGQSEENQIYFARTGLLGHLVRHVVNHTSVRQTESLLQTSFDLIGEIIKYNRINVELLEHLLCSSASASAPGGDGDATPGSSGKDSEFSDIAKQDNSFSPGLKSINKHTGDYYGFENLLSDSALGDSFSSFIKVVMDNVIDSNVFLRSLYLTVEEINAANIKLRDSRESKSVKSLGTLLREMEPKIATNLAVASNVRYSDFGSLNNQPIPAEASYLTHSWYQYVPAMSSQREMASAGAMLGLPGYRSDCDSSDQESALGTPGRKKSGSKSSKSPGRMISALGNGLMGAFRGILGKSKKQSDAQCGDDDNVSESNSNSGSAADSDDESFKTAHDSDIAADASPSAASAERPEKQSPPTGHATPLPATPAAGAKTVVDPRNEWLLSPAVQKLSSFLTDAKSRILLRLMSTVTLRSINHENICCINTAVLIFMFDHRRGILGETLAEVRQLSAKFGKCYCSCSKPNSATTNAPAHAPATPNGNGNGGGSFDGTEGGADGATPATPQTPAKDPSGVEVYILQSRDGCMFCKPYHSCFSSTGNVNDSGNVDEISSPVMVNFRQLLWYWTEYYFRRGRDRLSLEFSSHISFSCWRDIVGKHIYYKRFAM
jgi:hypothetical protein